MYYGVLLLYSRSFTGHSITLALMYYYSMTLLTCICDGGVVIAYLIHWWVAEKVSDRKMMIYVWNLTALDLRLLIVKMLIVCSLYWLM